MLESLLHVDGQTVHFGSSEHLPLADESVDFVVTSPPYWNLKRYGHPNEIGQEGYGTYLDRMNSV